MIHAQVSSISSPSGCCSDQIFIQNPNFSPKSKTLISLPNRNHFPKALFRICKASLGYRNGEGADDDGFLQASLLVSETVRHYSLWKQGFVENTKWHAPGRSHLYSHQRKEEKPDASLIGLGILRRFQSPTIFLKIACDGDLLLPIVVGEFAISQLIGALSDDQHEECPDQLQFAKNIVLKFGYEVNMVRITERIVNTYQACIYLGKRPKDVNISINARPSDAINVAERFKLIASSSRNIKFDSTRSSRLKPRPDLETFFAVQIYKLQFRSDFVGFCFTFVTFSFKIHFNNIETISVRSKVEGHDPLAEEIYMIQKMKTAVLEERYEHAAMWRDKIANLRMQSQEL